MPLEHGSNWGTDVAVDGYESGPDVDSNSRRNMIGAGYFSTLGVPLLAGREFTVADNTDSEKVIIVNEAFTRKFGLDPTEAVGKYIGLGGKTGIGTVIYIQPRHFVKTNNQIGRFFYQLLL